MSIHHVQVHPISLHGFAHCRRVWFTALGLWAHLPAGFATYFLVKGGSLIVLRDYIVCSTGSVASHPSRIADQNTGTILSLFLHHLLWVYLLDTQLGDLSIVIIELVHCESFRLSLYLYFYVLHLQERNAFITLVYYTFNFSRESEFHTK